MKIEEELFEHYLIRRKAAVKYGFRGSKGLLFYAEDLLDGSFRAEITIREDDTLTGKVIDTELEEEYIAVHVDSEAGSFLSKVREAYRDCLLKIRKNCFSECPFSYPQANRLNEYIEKEYRISAVFPYKRQSSLGIYSSSAGEKIALIYKKEEREILELHLDGYMASGLLREKGFEEAEQLDPSVSVSIVLDHHFPDETIETLIDLAFKDLPSAAEWIVPANPAYYDVVHMFDGKKTALWKQSSRIRKGDIVYIYVAAPYSEILFQCEAVETDIPYEYSGKNVSMRYVMELRLLKRYTDHEYPFSRLQKLGIKAIRGPRKIREGMLK